MKLKASEIYLLNNEEWSLLITKANLNTGYKKMLNFMTNIKNRNYESLTVKQRNWASQIVEDVRKEIGEISGV